MSFDHDYVNHSEWLLYFSDLIVKSILLNLTTEFLLVTELVTRQ